MFRLASIWQRASTVIVDVIVINILFIAILLLIPGVETIVANASAALAKTPIGRDHPLSKVTDLVESMIFLILALTYIIGFWIWKDATPGKMLLKLKIVDARTGGEPSVGQYLLRYLGYILSGIFYLGFIWVLFDKKNQGWHDKIARTLVICED